MNEETRNLFVAFATAIVIGILVFTQLKYKWIESILRLLGYNV